MPSLFSMVFDLPGRNPFLRLTFSLPFHDFLELNCRIADEAIRSYV